MSKLLDLRKQGQERVKVVEHIIFKPRSFKFEMIKLLSVIFTVLALGWGISKADNLDIITPKEEVVEYKNFSALGQVSNITETTISLENARSSNGTNEQNYTFDLSTVEKLETNDYQPIIITDIQIGQKVVVQGLDNDGEISIKRVIYFGEIATTTATTTLDVATTTEDVATTTDETATSTDDTATTTEVTETSTTTEEATTTPETNGVIENIVDAVNDVVDVVVDTVENVVDAVTGDEPEPAPIEEAPQPEVEETPEPAVEEPAPEPTPAPET